ncbi:MAG: hypothetical protein HY459_03590 [Parcubacteria group bacterium]|nr:hypothetical protein [Parcubacteria group bacterium]MBI4457412.1 hypothetical protein [Candidatus Uhrbacteria bacterium]
MKTDSPDFEVRVSQLIAKMFHSNLEDSETWKDWIDDRGARWDVLEALIESGVRDAFKARAIAIWLTPQYRPAPCYFSGGHGCLGIHGFDAAKISPALQAFAAEVLIMVVDRILPSGDREARRPLDDTNRYILKLLGVLPEDHELTARLFGRYQLNDPVEGYDMDDSSGYNPFYQLLNEEVPECWKQAGDLLMQRRILHESEGWAKPRAEWEGALACYAHHIQLPLINGKIKYAPDLFRSQIDCLMRFSDVKLRINGWAMAKTWAYLAGDQHRELRRRYARHAVFINNDNGGPFRCTGNTYDFAKAVLAEFRETDAQLAERLVRLIDEHEVERQAQQAIEAARVKKTKDIIDRMR